MDLEDQVVQEARVVRQVASMICRECKICRRMIQEGPICAKVDHLQVIQIIVVLLQDKDDPVGPVDPHKEHQEDLEVHLAVSFHLVIHNDKVHLVSLDNQVLKDKGHLALCQVLVTYSEMQDHQEANDELKIYNWIT